ncbi:MAG: hypothetical protein JST89_10800 [Cyanobacteria bacterium SZAS-4]|nr:hypothetical protein [Cyanobacteria bacterium SZAS-4]
MRTKSFYYVVLSTAAILGIAVIALAVQNFQTIPFTLFGGAAPLSLGATLIGAWIAGLVASVAVWQTKLVEVRSEKKLQQWDVQDQKLAKEVASDNVKLLEAKVATLEAALTKALERKKSS